MSRDAGPFSVTSGKGRPNNSSSTRNFQTESTSFWFGREKNNKLFDDLFGAVKVGRMIYVTGSVYRNVSSDTTTDNDDRLVRYECET